LLALGSFAGVPLSTRTGTKDAGEVWVSLRTEGGSEGGYGKEMGTTGAGYGQEKDYGTQGYGQQYGTTEGREREGMYGTTGTTTTGTGQGVVCDQQYFT